ncbi:hypothetical protein ACS0TY_024350 [Phlomoides rotata]
MKVLEVLVTPPALLRNLELFWMMLIFTTLTLLVLNSLGSPIAPIMATWQPTLSGSWDTFRNVYVVMEEAAEVLTAIQAETAILGNSEERLLAEIEDGDRNSKFFHTMNRIRKTSTGLSSLLIDDVLSFNSEAISDKVVDFFSELFTNQDHDTYDDSVLDTFIQPVLDPVDNEMLTCLPSVEEIKTAAFYMEPTSSPGPDGFGGTFYHACWDIITFDVIEEFRPIVMGNYLFNIFTKIIATRLGRVAARIPTLFQFGFVPGHRIHTCIALASDTINILDSPRVSGNMAVKIDIHKAFDTISWRFLLAMLHKMGFSTIFCDMISAILHSARLSVLINRSSRGYVGCSRSGPAGGPTVFSSILFG